MTIYPFLFRAIKGEKSGCVAMWPYQGDQSKYGNRGGKNELINHETLDGFSTRIICNGGEAYNCAPIRADFFKYWKRDIGFGYDIVITAIGMFNSHLPLIAGKEVSFRKGVNRSQPLNLVPKGRQIIAENCDSFKKEILEYPNSLGLIFPKAELPEGYRIPTIDCEICSNFWMPYTLMPDYKEEPAVAAIRKAYKEGHDAVVEAWRKHLVEGVVKTTRHLHKIAHDEKHEFTAMYYYEGTGPQTREEIYEAVFRELSAHFPHAYECRFRYPGHIGTPGMPKWCCTLASTEKPAMDRKGANGLELEITREK